MSILSKKIFKTLFFSSLLLLFSCSKDNNSKPNSNTKNPKANYTNTITTYGSSFTEGEREIGEATFTYDGLGKGCDIYLESASLSNSETFTISFTSHYTLEEGELVQPGEYRITNEGGATGVYYRGMHTDNVAQEGRDYSFDHLPIKEGTLEILSSTKDEIIGKFNYTAELREDSVTKTIEVEGSFRAIEEEPW